MDVLKEPQIQCSKNWTHQLPSKVLFLLLWCASLTEAPLFFSHMQSVCWRSLKPPLPLFSLALPEDSSLDSYKSTYTGFLPTLETRFAPVTSHLKMSSTACGLFSISRKTLWYDPTPLHKLAPSLPIIQPQGGGQGRSPKTPHSHLCALCLQRGWVRVDCGARLCRGNKSPRIIKANGFFPTHVSCPSWVSCHSDSRRLHSGTTADGATSLALFS